MFSVYRTQRDENPREEESPNEDLIGPAYSLVTTIAGGSSYTLLADWDYGEEGSPIDTSSPASFVQPWIVGACHWLQLEEEEEQYTAFCLVWEHEYMRRWLGEPDENRGIGEAALCSTGQMAALHPGCRWTSRLHRFSHPAWTRSQATRSW